MRIRFYNTIQKQTLKFRAQGRWLCIAPVSAVSQFNAMLHANNYISFIDNKFFLLNLFSQFFQKKFVNDNEIDAFSSA